MQQEVPLGKAWARKYPEQIVMVTTVGAASKPNIITLGWAMPTSSEPLLCAVSIMTTFYKKRPWPRLWWLAVAAGFTLFIHARGHQTTSQFTEKAQGMEIARVSRAEIEKGEGASMLASLYLKTYLHDKGGYTYGLPIISGVMFGALPRKYFPWKDWLVESYVRADITKIHGSEMMFGAKSSIIGDIYGCGGIIAILLGMPLLGILTRKLDGFLAPEAPLAVRTVGSIWLGSYWMMLGSNLLWGFSNFYLAGIPFAGIVLVSRILSPGAPAKKIPVPVRQAGVRLE